MYRSRPDPCRKATAVDYCTRIAATSLPHADLP